LDTIPAVKTNATRQLDKLGIRYELRNDVISISAGVRGTQIFLAPQDYIRATGATLAALTRI